MRAPSCRAGTADPGHADAATRRRLDRPGKCQAHSPGRIAGRTRIAQERNGVRGSAGGGDVAVCHPDTVAVSAGTGRLPPNAGEGNLAGTTIHGEAGTQAIGIDSHRDLGEPRINGAGQRSSAAQGDVAIARTDGGFMQEDAIGRVGNAVAALCVAIPHGEPVPGRRAAAAPHPDMSAVAADVRARPELNASSAIAIGIRVDQDMERAACRCDLHTGIDDDAAVGAEFERGGRTRRLADVAADREIATHRTQRDIAQRADAADAEVALPGQGQGAERAGQRAACPVEVVADGQVARTGQASARQSQVADVDRVCAGSDCGTRDTQRTRARQRRVDRGSSAIELECSSDRQRRTKRRAIENRQAAASNIQSLVAGQRERVLGAP